MKHQELKIVIQCTSDIHRFYRLVDRSQGVTRNVTQRDLKLQNNNTEGINTVK